MSDLTTSQRYPGFDLSRRPVLRLQLVGWFDAVAGGWNLRRAINAWWTFYMFDAKGIVISTAGGGEVAVPPRRLVLVPPGCRFNTTCTARVRQLHGYFDLSGVVNLRYAHLDRLFVLPVHPDDATLKRLIAAPGIQPGPRDLLYLAARLGQALAEVLPADVLAGADVGNDFLAKACRCIDEDYAQPLTVANLARLCGVSVNTFLRRFRAATGTTPAQAVRVRRVQVAAEALCQRNDSLDDIARACGFPNRHYLSRVFTAHMGTSPAAYRRRHQVVGV